MIEINFLEKKKINAVPFILIAIGLISIGLLIGGSLFYREALRNDHQNNLDLIGSNQAKIAEIERVNTVNSQLTQLQNQISQLDENLFPTVLLREEVAGLLPDAETTQVFDYQFSIEAGLSLRLQLNEWQQIADLERHFVEHKFFQLVSFDSVILTNEEEEIYQVSFKLELDRESMIRTDQDDD